MATVDAVNNIIQALNETDEQPRKQIAEIVEVLGDDIALGLLQEVKSVQDTGGLAVRDGTRQRTLGGVFFSLAKGKLPKADRNRIFRLRPPKPIVEAAAPAEARPPSPPQPRPARPDDDRRRVVEFSATPKGNAVGAGGLGRRRVVDVEILRQSPKPAPAAVPLAAVREPEPTPAPERRPEADARPLRRIVTLGPREEPPPTNPEEAATRVKNVMKALRPEEQRRVLSELLADLGGVKAPPPPPPPKGPENGASAVNPALRERVLASVTETLGLSTTDLARVLYGEESAGTRNKARAALERWRRSKS